MALLLPVQGVTPTIPATCFVAPNATLVGDVVLGEHCSVWFTAVIRGDVNYIRIGDYTNIQDGCVLHGTYQTAPTIIGHHVNIGHRAMVHGCTLQNHILVGMGAIVMDHALVEDYVIIAAGAVVLSGMVCESGYLYAGMPAKKVKPLTDAQRQLLDELPLRYVHYSSWFENEGDL
jgi:carbonic anhydrase/acetyltransferase-like protein (isoleucine patch superfamily)